MQHPTIFIQWEGRHVGNSFASGYRSLDNSLLQNVDAAVKHLEGELRKVVKD
jgi:hypothetical protein